MYLNFVKVMPKVLSVLFPRHGFLAKTAFFNDVTITSSLRSVVQVLMGHFTIFTHTDCQDNLCQKLWKYI